MALSPTTHMPTVAWIPKEFHLLIGTSLLTCNVCVLLIHFRGFNYNFSYNFFRGYFSKKDNHFVNIFSSLLIFYLSLFKGLFQFKNCFFFITHDLLKLLCCLIQTESHHRFNCKRHKYCLPPANSYNVT